MSELYRLKNKIDELDDLGRFENIEDAKLIKNRLSILREITSALADEIEKLDFIRPIKISQGINLRDEMRKFEIRLIQSALKQTGGNQTHAARLLGVSITTLNAKIKRMGISTTPDVASSVFFKRNILPESAEAI